MMLLHHVLQFIVQSGGTLQTWFGDSAPSNSMLDIAISPQWHVLGPFQLGTREAAWGADPLELYGGFHALVYDSAATLKSSLPDGGFVRWSNQTTTTTANSENDSTSIRLHIEFPAIDWASLRDVYGWAALQWQAWARGHITVGGTSEVTLACYTRQVLEYWIDDRRYFGGDFYGYDRAPLVVRLGPGEHTVDIRLIRDVRAFGGVGQPGVDIQVDLLQIDPDARPLFAGKVLLPDIIAESGLLVSPYASVDVRNDALQAITIHSIKEVRNSCAVELLTNKVFVLAPGQTRPLAFRMDCKSFNGNMLHFALGFRLSGSDEDSTLSYTSSLHEVDVMYEPQKMTYLHPSGIVSYAIVRPPSINAIERYKEQSLPVLVALHGAGVEADSDMARHALDPLPDLGAWVVFASGVTSWCGDDWHVWGGADIQAAVDAIPDWAQRMNWTGPAPDVSRWIVMGHSNGGQGTWHALTHLPDRVVAAAPLSGYSSIQTYVPYYFWQISDPGREAVVQAALLNYRHELLLENTRGVSIYQQHGSADDNVPAYHSRLMHQRLEQVGANSTYVEIAGKPHYWDGVMTTEPLRAFLEQQLDRLSDSPSAANKTAHRLSDFTLVAANPADTGSKHGVRIEQLIVPGRLGWIDFAFDEPAASCTIRTQNILRFVLPGAIMDQCKLISVDEQPLQPTDIHPNATNILTQQNNRWTTNAPNPSTDWRHPTQQGGLDAILRSSGAFHIVPHSPAAAAAALQISRNLCQYYAADTILTDTYDHALRASSAGNIVSLAIGTAIPAAAADFPLTVTADAKLSLRGPRRTREFAAGEHGLGAIFLRPLEVSSGQRRRLELVVWGADEASLALAARLVPLMTGTGQPDFVVVDASMSWKGVDGALAMGLFDARWEVSENSFL